LQIRALIAGGFPNRYSAVFSGDPHRPEIADRLEMQLGVKRILREKLVLLFGTALDFSGQIVEAFPEPWGGARSEYQERFLRRC
jgi:hypothetical protein